MSKTNIYTHPYTKTHFNTRGVDRDFAVVVCCYHLGKHFQKDMRYDLTLIVFY